MIEFRVRFRTVAVVATLALSMLVVGTAIGATLQKNGGPVTAVRTATADSVAITSEKTWSDIPGMSVAINIPTGERALLIATFSATHQCNVSGTGGGYCMIRVLVDGNPAQPLETVFSSASSTHPHFYETNSMQFVAGPKLSGAHTVKVQYRTQADTSLLYFNVDTRTLTVLSSKV